MIISPRSTQAESNSPGIFGGEEAAPHAYPWQVMLTDANAAFGEYRCGGTLINEQWVLTAAHCLERNVNEYVPTIGSPNEFRVIAGRHDRFVAQASDEIRAVAQIFVPFDYTSAYVLRNTRGKYDYDIALLRLAQPIYPAEQIRSLGTFDTLSSNLVMTDTWAMAIGWGSIERDWRTIKLSAKLRQAQLKISVIDDKFISASDGDVGVRHGDSGSSLMVLRDDGTWVLAGVSSLSNGFTRVAAFTDWIEQTTRMSPRQFLPLIGKVLMADDIVVSGIWGNVTALGQPVANIEVGLYKDNSYYDSALRPILTTTTDEHGIYQFQNVPTLSNGVYRVRYSNRNNPKYLAYWQAIPKISKYTAGEIAHGGSFDIANSVLRYPVNNPLSLNNPMLFYWEPRNLDASGETYRVEIYDVSTQALVYTSPYIDGNQYWLDIKQLPAVKGHYRWQLGIQSPTGEGLANELRVFKP
ncbi:MAG: trypsin-like serine protease [Anaerolineae bacterium]|nr:trypsin-like serine protease [Anaerolineae bacterium]